MLVDGSRMFIKAWCTFGSHDFNDVTANGLVRKQELTWNHFLKVQFSGGGTDLSASDALYDVTCIYLPSYASLLGYRDWAEGLGDQAFAALKGGYRLMSSCLPYQAEHCLATFISFSTSLDCFHYLF